MDGGEEKEGKAAPLCIDAAAVEEAQPVLPSLS